MSPALLRRFSGGGTPRSGAGIVSRVAVQAVLLARLLGDAVSAWADEPSRAYLAQTWTSEEGLPATEVSALVQSSDGYLWIGTPGGLARFDGDRFQVFRKAETRGLTSNRILSLCNDPEGGVWVGTDGGGLTRLRSDDPEVLTRVQGLSSSIVLSVCVDGRGDLWAGTSAGLNRWQVNRFIPYMRVDGLPDETVAVVRPAGTGGLLVGTGAGVGWFRDGRFEGIHPRPRIPEARIADLRTDRAGNLWMAGDAGVWRVNPSGDGQGVAQQLSGEPGTTLLLRHNGDMCWGTGSGRLMTLDGDSGSPRELYRMESAPTALLEDHESNLWIGSRQGLTRIKRRELRFLAEDDGGETTGYAAVDSDSTMQIRQDGTVRWSLPGQAAASGGMSAATRITAVDVQGPVFWLGTSGEGLWRREGSEWRSWGQRDGLSDIFVESVWADGPDAAWVGTRNGGLNHVSGGRIRRYLTPWGYSGHYARVLAGHPDGTLWIGTTGDGLFALREGRFTRYPVESGLPDARITGLLVEADGIVWAGTAAGLGMWDGVRWRAFGGKTGVSTEAVDQLRDDDLGHLWLGCGQTLYRIAKSQLREVALGLRETVDSIPYGRADGLQGATFLPEVQVAAHGRRDQVQMPTSRGVLIIEPGGLERNTQLPPVLIQEVLIAGEAAPRGRRIEVPPGSPSIQFRFAALSFAAPEKVRFRCRLSGFDGDWVDLGGSRSVRYPRVPHGEHRFEVTACNNDGLWNPVGASVALTVLPFWWETPLFRVGAAGLGGGIALGSFHLRRMRRREIERLRVRIAGDLHDEIGSSLWSITLLSKMLQQGSSLGDEEKRDAGEIHRIATQTSNALRDIVWLINPGLDTVQDLVLRMRDHLSAALRSMDVRISADGADPARKLSLEWRQSFFLVFKEAVTNAAKHGRARRIEVTLTEGNGCLELCVADDGRGFDPDRPGAGHGLKSLRRRAEAVRGRLVIESAPGRGTRVILRASVGR